MSADPLPHGRPGTHTVTAYAWAVVGLLWFVALLNYLDRIMIMTMRESLRAAMPMNDKQFSMLSTIFLWVYAAFSPIMGFIADRFNRSYVIIISMIVWSTVTLLTGYATTYEELFVARALMGISEACYIPAALALITDYHRGSTRSTATGIHLSGLNVGAALGCLGGVFAVSHDWSFPFRLFGAIGIGYSVVLILFLRDRPKDDRNIAVDTPRVNLFHAIQQLFLNRQFLSLIVIWSLIGLAGWLVHKWSPTYLQERFGLDQGMAGVWSLVPFQVGCIAGFFIAGSLSDFWNRTNPRARVLMPMIGLFFAAPAIYLHATGATFFLVVAGVLIFGFARVFTDSNLMPILCEIVDSRYRATAYGILNAFSCLAGGLGIYVGGYLRDENYSITSVFEFASGGVLFCAFLLVFLRIKPRTISTTE